MNNKEDFTQLNNEKWGNFYSQILDIENEENIKIPKLQVYLQSIYKLLNEYKNESACLELFYKIIKRAFYEEPIEFNNEWLKVENEPEEDSFTDGFEYLKEVLIFQIAELKRMENKELKDEYRFFGITSETNNSWYNFSPFDNLECGIRGFIDNIPFSRVDSKNITWKTLGIIIEIGRIYE